MAEHPHDIDGGRRHEHRRRDYSLDPVTFEVLKNAFVTIVDEMAEQILRTCHSFVIYARDFSLGAVRRRGQHGHAGQPGHRRARRHAAPHRQGRDRGLRGRHPRGRRVRHQRPLPRRHALQRRAHHPADLPRRRADRASRSPTATGPTSAAACRARSTSPPRSTSARACAIPPVRIVDRGHVPATTSSRLIVSNTRAPERHRGRPARPGRGHARGRARDPAAGRQVRRRHGRDRVRARSRTTSSGSRASAIAELPDGTWETEDYIDFDPAERRGPGPDQGQADDRRRPAALRPRRARTRRSGRS